MAPNIINLQGDAQQVSGIAVWIPVILSLISLAGNVIAVMSQRKRIVSDADKTESEAVRTLMESAAINAKTLGDRITALTDKVDKIERDNEDKDKLIDDLKKQIADLQSQLDKMEKDNADKDKIISMLEKHVSELEAQLNEERQRKTQ